MLDAHPAIGGRPTSATSAREQGTDDDPAVLAELAELNRAYEAEVRLSLRRLRQPPPAARDRPDPARAAGAHARARSSRPASTSSCRSRSIDGATLLALADYWWGWGNLLFRWLHVIAGIAWIGASFYFIALDNHLEPPRDPRDAERGVGGEAWEIHGGGFYRVEKFRVAPERLPEHAALVQVGGVHDVALRVRAARRRLLRARLGVPRRPDGRGSLRLARRSRSRSRGSRSRGSSTTGSAACSRTTRACSRCSCSRSSALRMGRRGSSSRRAPRTSRSAR